MLRQSHIKKLLINYNRRLQALKERQALDGRDTPVAVLTEIEDIEAEIEKLQIELQALGRETVKPKNDNQTIATIKALCNEIDFNLHKIDRFVARGYRVVGNEIMAGDKTGVEFRYITCVTSLFESAEVQQALLLIQEDIKRQLFNVYHGFREINDRADALKKVFRIWRAEHYIKAIEEFNSTIRSEAEELRKSLPVLEL